MDTTFEIYYRLQHKHKDGSWGEMEDQPEHRAPAHDSERKWGIARIFRCNSCDEYVTVVPPGQEAAPHSGD
jgi:hypothetical protein